MPDLLRQQSLAEQVASWPANERERFFAALSPDESFELVHAWPFWARPSRLLPEGEWTSWVILGGRGSGKTRTGAQTILHWPSVSRSSGWWGAPRRTCAR